MKFTKNYNMSQPEQNDFVIIHDLNQNTEIIDMNMKKLEDSTHLLHDNLKTQIEESNDSLNQEEAARIAADAELQTTKEDIANKGTANGYAALDENAKLSLSQLPDAIIGQMVHAGDVDASTLIANLTSAGQTILGVTDTQIILTNDTNEMTGYTDNQGNYYIVTRAGTFAGILYHVGDWIIANSTGWGIVNNTDEVTGVKGNAETNYRIGNIDISLENLGYSAQATEPTASSTDGQLPTAKRLWTMMGGALSGLKTTAKTITEAINELWGNTYSLSGGAEILANEDLNNYGTIGNYYCKDNVTSATIVNTPTSRAFTLKVDRGNGVAYIRQTIKQIDGKTWTRYYSTDPSNTRWTDWISATQSTDMTNYYALAGREEIPARSNLNTYITSGSYICRSDADAATISNTFTQQTFLLTVEKADRYVMQTQKIIYDGRLISRYYIISTGVWSAWSYEIQNTDLAKITQNIELTSGFTGDKCISSKSGNIVTVNFWANKANGYPANTFVTIGRLNAAHYPTVSQYFVCHNASYTKFGVANVDPSGFIHIRFVTIDSSASGTVTFVQ